MKSCHRHRSMRGFTLVELLVVIAIVATLTVISFAGVRRMIDRARSAESTTNLRSLVLANMNYLADHGVFCPADDQGNNRRWHGARRSRDAKFDPTRGFLSPYLGESQRVTLCPLFQAMVKDADSFEDGSGGYGYNAAYIGGKPGGVYDRVTKIRVSERLANVDDPARTVMFATTAYAKPGGLQEYPYCEPPFWDFGSGPTGARPSPSVHFRANGKALVAWCDGRVTSESPNKASAGANPHGGDASKHKLGWFGPERNNGYWNTRGEEGKL